MCLILIREPDVLLDFEDIKRACLNNPHGWGYVIPDRGKLEIRRFYDPKGTDPEEVYTVLDDFMDKQVYLHLRWATHGSRSKANVHPFPALTERKDGMQVWVMHNGTLNSYSRKGERSDTYHFTDEVITPLLRRFRPALGENLLIDPFVTQVIEKFSAGWSKFVLIDNYGNHSIIGSGGVQKDGYWLSNEYSFKPEYRTPTNYTPYKHTPSSYQDNYSSRSQVQTAEYEEVDSSDNPFRNTNPTDGTGQSTKTALIEAAWADEEPLEVAAKTQFHETLGLQNLRDLCALSEEDILDMVNEFPEVMAVLIRDLLFELYNKG